MARLPDQFDLWVRKARECRDPERQADYLLGSLAGLRDWSFLNVGSRENPQPAQAKIGEVHHLLVFSDSSRIEELLDDQGSRQKSEPLPLITIPTSRAMPWCLAQRSSGCGGLLVNPGEEAFTIPLDQLEIFHQEWIKRGERQASGFWTPNMTSEEEDFWQEHGL